MTSTTSGKEIHADPDSAAATWFARLQGDDVSSQDRQDFQRCLDADARNAAAWDDVSGTWNDLSGLESDAAFAARQLGISAVIAMPAATPRNYLDATREVLKERGGLWFFDESYVISRRRD